MKNPLVWLFQKPESLMYIFLMPFMAWGILDFNSSHPHEGFIYYMLMVWGCIFIGAYLYIVFNYENKKYHNLIFLLCMNIHFLLYNIARMSYIPPEGFNFYFRIFSIILFTASLILVIIKRKRFLYNPED